MGDFELDLFLDLNGHLGGRALSLHEFHNRAFIQTVESVSDDIPVIYATDCALLLSTRQRQNDMNESLAPEERP